jgi:hypothetical protein
MAHEQALEIQKFKHDLRVPRVQLFATGEFGNQIFSQKMFRAKQILLALFPP